MGGPNLQYSFLVSLRLRSRSPLNGTSQLTSTPRQTVVPLAVTPFIPHDTHPRANSGAQGIMWPVEYQSHDVSNSCTWNGGAHQNPSLQGVFEMRAAARHHKENAAIKHDPARRAKNSIPLIDKDTQIAYLLAAPCAQLVYDRRYPPPLYFPPSSSYAGWGSEGVLTLARRNRIRLISQDFPWAFNISPEPSAAEQGIMCIFFLNALHAALQRPPSDTEWGAAAQDKQASLIRARDRRLNMKPALWLRSGHDADAQPARREPLILRVD
ncbi:hypothetical protein EV424DRAFT_98205 [Suillus variegatus]|nr:hypothetical protein EV424DRAFT_98205 [Suillus variegatus]